MATPTRRSFPSPQIQADTARLIFRLAHEGDGTSGPMGVKSITTHLNEAGIRTRDGGRWGVGAVHKVLTRTAYIGRHRFNTRFWKTTGAHLRAKSWKCPAVRAAPYRWTSVELAAYVTRYAHLYITKIGAVSGNAIERIVKTETTSPSQESQSAESSVHDQELLHRLVESPLDCAQTHAQVTQTAEGALESRKSSDKERRRTGDLANARGKPPSRD